MKKIMKVVAAASLLVSLWGPGAVLAAASPETVKAASVTVVDRSYRDNAVQLWAIKNYANGDKTTWLIGTGFFVEGGYIVSAYHSVDVAEATIEEEGQSLEFFIKDGDVTSKAHSVEVVASDKNLDLVLFKTDLVDHPYFELADVVSEGQEMFMIGNSFERSIAYTEFAEVKGNITRLHDFTTLSYVKDGPVFTANYRMHATATSLPGDSGGPALNKDKEVIGVVIGSLWDNRNAVIVKLEDVRGFVSKSLASLDEGVIQVSAKNPS